MLRELSPDVRGCPARNGDNTGHIIDREWFHEQLMAVLSKWLQSSVTAGGMFWPRLDRQWRPHGEQTATLVSQCRLLYNFAKGYEVTGEERFRQAVANGAEWLIDHLGDESHGGWMFSCDGAGRVLDDRKDSYGHAFALFGLAHAASCLGDEGLANRAARTWDTMRAKLFDPYGGVFVRTSRDFRESEPGKSQNPLMHLFEALLAMGDLPGRAGFYDEAQKVGDFVLTRLVRQTDHCLPEAFAHDWTELPEDQGGRLDLGHAFEWAYLLSAAVERGLPAAYLDQADRFLEYGLRIGFDRCAGGVFSPASPDGNSVRPIKGWWEQCEAIRALCHFAALRGRADLWEPLQQTLTFATREFVDREYGGWYSGPWTPDGGLTRHDKGSEWKVDYHLVGMCVEALRWG